MRDFVYRVVLLDRDYDFNKVDSSIESARRGAKVAFPRERVTISRVGRAQACENCLCAPCCCMLMEANIKSPAR